MALKCDVSVVIATSLQPSRAALLVRAVDSILTQEGCRALPIIVVNGNKYDQAALEFWRGRKDVRLIEVAEGDYIKARRFGREGVDTEFFGFLDDDDIYLPGCLANRLAPMRADASIDVVVGNGIIEHDGREIISMKCIDLHRHAPLIGLASENWMPSACAALFRATAVGVEYFSHQDRWMEWTALAYRLSVDRRKIVFLDDLTFRIADTPGSLSKTLGYRTEAAETLRMLLGIAVPKEARRVWERKYSAALHGLADFYLSRGDMLAAWKAHLRSLLWAGGSRYLLYTRWLVVALARSRIRYGTANVQDGLPPN